MNANHLARRIAAALLADHRLVTGLAASDVHPGTFVLTLPDGGEIAVADDATPTVPPSADPVVTATVLRVWRETAGRPVATPAIAAALDTYATLTRSDLEWTPDGAPACTCGKPECLICLVESLAGPGSVEMAAEVA